MQYTLMLWHADHVNFGRLLNILERELEQVHDAEAPDYELMLDIMYYISHYSDVLHHPKEDLVFARIKARDPKAARVVDELTAQHVRLRAMGEALVGALDDVMNDGIVPRERIEAAVSAYVEEFRAHMDMEESEILPLADRVLGDQDWTEIDAAIANFEDPLFGLHVHERYRSLREQINRHAQRARA